MICWLCASRGWRWEASPSHFGLGLNYNDAVLKDFLQNVCLHEPRPQCEIEKLQTLDYWGFINYPCYHSLVASPGQSEPTAVPQELHL